MTWIRSSGQNGSVDFEDHACCSVPFVFDRGCRKGRPGRSGKPGRPRTERHRLLRCADYSRCFSIAAKEASQGQRNLLSLGGTPGPTFLPLLPLPLLALPPTRAGYSIFDLRGLGVRQHLDHCRVHFAPTFRSSHRMSRIRSSVQNGSINDNDHSCLSISYTYGCWRVGSSVAGLSMPSEPKHRNWGRRGGTGSLDDRRGLPGTPPVTRGARGFGRAPSHGRRISSRPLPRRNPRTPVGRRRVRR